MSVTQELKYTSSDKRFNGYINDRFQEFRQILSKSNADPCLRNNDKEKNAICSKRIHSQREDEGIFISYE